MENTGFMCKHGCKLKLISSILTTNTVNQSCLAKRRKFNCTTLWYNTSPYEKIFRVVSKYSRVEKNFSKRLQCYWNIVAVG